MFKVSGAIIFNASGIEVRIGVGGKVDRLLSPANNRYPFYVSPFHPGTVRSWPSNFGEITHLFHKIL